MQERLLAPVAADAKWLIHLDLKRRDEDEDELLNALEPETLRRDVTQHLGFGLLDMSDTASMTQLVDALRGNTHVRTVSLANHKNLGDAGVQALLPALADCAVERVDFDECGKISRHMKAAVVSACLPNTLQRLAEDDPTLVALSISREQVLTANQITELIDALRNNSHLRSFKIRNEQLNDGHLEQLARVWKTWRCGSLQRVLLKGYGNLTDAGWAKLLPTLAALQVPNIHADEGVPGSQETLHAKLQFLRTNATIIDVQDYWQEVSVGDNDIRALAAALRANTQIRGIDLEGPNLTQVQTLTEVAQGVQCARFSQFVLSAQRGIKALMRANLGEGRNASIFKKFMPSSCNQMGDCWRSARRKLPGSNLVGCPRGVECTCGETGGILQVPPLSRPEI